MSAEDPRIQTISRGLIGAQQLQFELRQKSDRDYVYEQLLPDARLALDSLAADLQAKSKLIQNLELDLKAAREALEEARPYFNAAKGWSVGAKKTLALIDAALARLPAGKETGDE